MPIDRSYLDKTFRISDADSLIRKDNLFDFVTWAAGDNLPAGVRVGDKKRIPVGTQVKIVDVQTLGLGFANRDAIAKVTSTDGRPIGWTATLNFAGLFVNETIGLLPPPVPTDDKGSNASWVGGKFIRQETLAQIIGADGKVKRLTQPTLEPYVAMVDAARKAGIAIALTSGFRAFAEQVKLFQLHQQGGTLAAAPGTSPHQNGVALDIAVDKKGPGDPSYDWLAANATSFGFLRTVQGEAWHWEHRPGDAASAKARGTFKIRPMDP